MDARIGIGIVGYGNIGRAVEMAVAQNPDMEVAGIFTRRDPGSVIPKYDTSKVHDIEKAESFKGKIDVAILCGGSATDLPEQGPLFASIFNTVDSFDTHARIPEYFASVDRAAKQAGTTSIISTGWDPGLFSLMRVMGESVLPDGASYTFWGPGLSQGHSDAIRRITGVVDARQYTIPIDGAVDRVRAGEQSSLTAREKHWRDCYVVAADGADQEKIRREITEMPHYFDEYDTKVTFISLEEMKEKHATMPHGGFVVRTGVDDAGNKSVYEFSLKLESNPGFTASVLVAYARAAYRLSREGQTGAKTVFDIAPAYLSMRGREELIRDRL